MTKSPQQMLSSNCTQIQCIFTGSVMALNKRITGMQRLLALHELPALTWGWWP